MGKVGYLFKIIKNMNYGQLFKTVEHVHKKTKKNKISILKDVVNCGLKYQAGYTDYRLFEMYNLNEKQRKTIVTRGINNDLVKRYNNPEYKDYFNDRSKFNKKFHKYLERDWLIINNTEDSFEEFKEFCEKHSTIIVKSVLKEHSKDVEIFKVTKKNTKDIYNQLLKSKRCLVEEVAKQYESLSNLHPTSVNTFRIITLNQEIVAAYLCVGNNNNVVDDFNKEGLVAPINIETGIIDYLAIDKEMNEYDRHPITNEAILWFQIPKWPRIKRFVIQASKEIPEIGYVGWDVSLNEKDPYLIGGNEYPEHDLYQLPPHRTDGIGLLPRFEQIMNKKGE